MKSLPSLYTRRRFLHHGLLGGAAGATVPLFLSRTLDAVAAAAAEAGRGAAADQPVLVVLQMAGGNDGLNTLVPFANDHYRRARPRLGLRPADVLKLTDAVALHPSLQPLRALYDDGQLSIVQGVGYPNPNRSHFRSTEIWHTATDAERTARHGWLGRYFDSACRGCDPTIGVNIGKQTPQAFAGPRPLGISLEQPEQYRFAAGDGRGDTAEGGSEAYFRKLNQAMEADDDEGAAMSGASVGAVAGTMAAGGSPLDFLERTALDAQLSSDRVLAITRRGRNLAEYPPSSLANALRLVARLIGGGLPSRVFYVSQGGYDTHTNQATTHERLLREFAGSLKAFLDDVRAQGQAKRVLVMTFSEFGRRVAENASGGTDHGAASVLFLAGAGLQPGLLGQTPSLAPADLLNGDPRYTVDFRQVYAAVLQGWLGVESEPILGRRFNPLPLLKGHA